jgi:S-adenosyl methyltransferase
VDGLDISKPNIARVYDYWLGGKDNFAADRELAHRLAALWPPWVDACRDNRKFVCRVVTWAAERGITQFLDLGAGLPTHPSVHETARAVHEHARVVYVDIDPVVVSHTLALMATADGVIAAKADLAEPARVLGLPEVTGALDLSEPVCVIFGMVLHFFKEATVRVITAGYAERLASGSVMMVSCARGDDEDISDKMGEDYTPGPIENHSGEEIVAFLDGLDVVPPGLALAHAWRGGMPTVPNTPPGPVYVQGAVGVKP